MEHEEFTIGMEFMCGGKRWRCTDRGTRTVIAICLDTYPDDPSWYNGPPYAVAESVFDEYDRQACAPVDQIGVQSQSKAKNSA
jgi:hypothetical protein